MTESAGVATRMFFKTQFICAVISIHQPRGMAYSSAYNQSLQNTDSSGILISIPKFASKFYGRLEQFVL
jgi:predicted transcriptional regulator